MESGVKRSQRDYTLAFKLRVVDQVEKGELPAAELFRTTGDPVLTLVTCGGSFSKSRRSYADNIVIRAVPA